MSKNFKRKLSLKKLIRIQKKFINDSYEEFVNEGSINDKFINEESVNEDSVNEDSVNEEFINDEFTNEESVNEESENDFNNKKFKDDDIRNIIFEKINNRFAYSKLDKFKIVIMIDNGYINATKLCKYTNKQLIHWMENKRSKEIIKDFGKNIGSSRDDLVIRVNGGKLTKISGTYVHPILITHFVASNFISRSEMK
jgi:hypothetical protein